MNNLCKITYSSNKAFTLIELIVVISLISILLAFSIPRLDISFFSDDERKLSTWILLNVKSLKEKAVREQTLQVLNIDLDNNQMWSSFGPVTEAAAEDESLVETPKENTYKIPSGYRVTDVEFLNAGKITKGIAEIYFYKKGYSDKALIHIEHDDNTRYSYLIEPFLPHVKIFEEYIEF